jgi:hypothetical protein
VPRLDDKVSDRVRGWVDDHTPHFAARTIRAARCGPDRELCLLCHCRPPFPVMVGYLLSSVILAGASPAERDGSRPLRPGGNVRCVEPRRGPASTGTCLGTLPLSANAAREEQP